MERPEMPIGLNPISEQAGPCSESTGIPAGRWSACRDMRCGIFVAIALLAWDIAFSGSFVLSLLVCPIWFIASIIKNAIQHPGWKSALLRIALPPLILTLVLLNNDYQCKQAKVNALRVIAACEAYQADHGALPDTLQALVPKYLPEVPKAKNCYAFGDFVYFKDSQLLCWYVIPPYGRRLYDFEDHRWSRLD